MVPLLALSACGAGFFATRRFRPLPRGWTVAVRLVASAPLILSGTLHLLRPQVFVALLPPPFPRASWLIVVTGLPELLGAVGLFMPGLRRPASVALAVFLLAIFPANIYVAGQTVAGLPMPGVPARWAMQAGYMLLVLVAGWGLPAIRTATPVTFDRV